MKRKYAKYIYWGVTGFVVVALLITLVFLFIEMGKVRAALRGLSNILAPVTYGAVLAYLMSPIYNRVSRIMMRLTEKTALKEKTRERVAGGAGILVSLLILIVLVTGLISMLIPQLVASIMGVVEGLPNSSRNLQAWLEQLLENNPQLEAIVMNYYVEAMKQLQSLLSQQVVPNVGKIYSFISDISSGFLSVLNVVKNILIGLIVMIYLLGMKHTLLTQMKMIIFGLFPVRIANKILEEARYVHSVFGGFIIGKLVDSLIIGILCFVLLNLMNMPYVLLISVIVGVTNVVPFFGPFIGAIPSTILILLADPIKSLWFLVFILLLQQFDGNILGPKILGGSTGISSFWVLFSILLFGGLFGFVGMIIGVPTFAVLYKLFRELIQWLLKRRGLPVTLRAYDDLDYMDEESKGNIEKQKTSEQ